MVLQFRIRLVTIHGYKFPAVNRFFKGNIIDLRMKLHYFLVFFRGFLSHKEPT